jgi:ABC-type bacteriocin/lantibiotic exporter with double-glycine peptidase domain
VAKTSLIYPVSVINYFYLELNRIVQVYMEENFCFEGTIKENLEWKNKLTDKTLAYKYCDLLRIKDDIPEYEKKGLEAFVL